MIAPFSSVSLRTICAGIRLAAVCCAALAAWPGTAQLMTRPGNQTDENTSVLIETMYTKGLQYLLKTQNKDGTFPGNYGNDPSVAGFCMMSALAHGDDPNVGPYAQMIKRSLDLILKSQDEKTGLIKGINMYTHGFATLALAEAYGMVRDDRIGPALKKAVDLILEAQSKNRLKAWRYYPESSDADTSVAGCQIVALFAARNAGIPVPDKALEDGLKFMASCRKPNGGYVYMYVNGEEPRVTLSSIGLLTMSLNKNYDDPNFAKTVAYLMKRINHREDTYPFYLEYYMSQAFFHGDEEGWKKWNNLNIRYMRNSQSPDGSWGYNQSPAFATSLSLLSMALNYRFLPIYEK